MNPEPRTLKPLLLAGLLALGVGAAVAQETLPLPAARQQLVKTAFSEFVPAYSLLKNGSYYHHFYPLTAGNQYYTDQALFAGSLEYEGIRYDSIPIGYDTYNQLVFVAILHGYKQEQLILNTQRIARFTAGQATFIRLQDSTYAGMQGGIYQLIFEGAQSRFLVAFRKDQVKIPSSLPGEKRYKFVEKESYYVLRKGVSSPIRSRRHLLEVWDNDAGMAGFIKKNRLRVRAGLPGFINEVVQALHFAETLQTD